MVAGLVGRAPADPAGDLLVGLDDGDDAAVVRHRRRHGGRRRPPTSSPRSSTTPTTGAGSPRPTRCPTCTRWAARRWSRSTCSAGRATCCRSSSRARCCAAGWTWPRAAGCHVAGGHSVDDPEPKYGMAVTGLADPAALLRNDAGRPGLPLTLTKPLGDRRAQQPAQGRPARCSRRRSSDDHAQPGRGGGRARRPASACATDVTGFGLLGHLLQAGPGQRGDARWSTRRRCRTWTAPGRRCADGYVSGGTRRNLDWVRAARRPAAVDEDELLLLADAQTSGGLLVAGEIPGAPGHRRARPARGRPDPRPVTRPGFL